MFRENADASCGFFNQQRLQKHARVSYTILCSLFAILFTTGRGCFGFKCKGGNCFEDEGYDVSTSSVCTCSQSRSDWRVCRQHRGNVDGRHHSHRHIPSKRNIMTSQNPDVTTSSFKPPHTISSMDNSN